MEKMETEGWNEWKGEAKRENLEDVLDFLEPYVEQIGLSKEERVRISIAVEEIFVNIASYAYATETEEKNAEFGNVLVKCRTDQREKMLYICLEDWGTPYNPLECQDPDITLGADEREIGGLGIFMVKNTMDQVEYRYEAGKNCMIMVKNLLKKQMEP